MQSIDIHIKNMNTPKHFVQITVTKLRESTNLIAEVFFIDVIHLLIEKCDPLLQAIMSDIFPHHSSTQQVVLYSRYVPGTDRSSHQGQLGTIAKAENRRIFRDVL